MGILAQPNSPDMWFNNTRKVTVCLEIFGARILAIFCSFPKYSPWKLDFLKTINSLFICEIRKSFIRNLLDFLRWLSFYLSDCKNIDNNLLYNCKITNRPCSFWGKFCNQLSRREITCNSLVWYILITIIHLIFSENKHHYSTPLLFSTINDHRAHLYALHPLLKVHELVSHEFMLFWLLMQ